MPSFTCVVCGQGFELAQALLDRYPGWTPRHCQAHRAGGGGGRASGRSGAQQRSAGGGGRAGGDAQAGRQATGARQGRGQGGGTPDGGGDLASSMADAMLRHSAGPDSGIFTDGSCEPNPGPGGWGLVRVREGAVVTTLHGHEPDTTNNRMEMLAVIQALELLRPDEAEVIYSDSQLVVKTLTEWARGWERAGWKRKSGPIANLDLVQRGYALMQARPLVQVRWVPGHSGVRWNEVADRLSVAWRG